MGLRTFFHKELLEAGCDEAGRGCLAGPVVAAAVILPKRVRLPGINDSKQLTKAMRDELRPIIEKKAIGFAVGVIDHEEIDRINILNASFKAMHVALDSLTTKPELLLIDGNRFAPYFGIPHHCVIGGDGRYASIAAASILAKTYRDALMQDLHTQYPHFGWDENKGYGTRFHRTRIAEHGLSPYHRRSFNMGLEYLKSDSTDLYLSDEENPDSAGMDRQPQQDNITAETIG